MQNAQQGKIFVKNPDMLLSWYGSIPYDDAKIQRHTFAKPSRMTFHSQKKQYPLHLGSTR